MIERVLICVALASLLGAAPAAAQDDSETRQQLRDKERALRVEDQELRAAERALQEAARRVAELSRKTAPEVLLRSERLIKASRGPRLGLQLELSSEVDDGERRSDSVAVTSVSPGSAAAEAGIKAGDLLIGFQGQSLRDNPAEEAVEMIAAGLQDKQVGDSVKITVLRDGEQQEYTATLNEQSFTPGAMAFAFTTEGDEGGMVVDIERIDGLRHLVEREHEFLAHMAPDAPMPPGGPNFFFMSSDSAWASMELVELSPRLGKYFGTDSGLLVVRAPEDESLGFEDGDVIRSIGGREPENVGHAMRILRSYESGEGLRIEILRDRKKRRLDIEVPEKVGSNDAGLHRQWLVERRFDNTPPAPSVP